MTNAPLYVALGIPALLALTNIAVTISLIGKVDARVDKVEARVDKLETRMDARFDKVDADLRRFFELFGRHDEAIETLKRKA